MHFTYNIKSVVVLTDVFEWLLSLNRIKSNVERLIYVLFCFITAGPVQGRSL